jgi:hypothetical protein
MGRCGIANVIADKMAEQSKASVWLGDYAFLQECWFSKHPGSTGIGPPDQIRRMMKAISRSSRFERDGYIRSIGFSNREVLHPYFRLRNQPHD